MMVKKLGNYKKKRIIFISSTLAISLLALIFIASNFRDNIVFYYSPSEILEQKIAQKIINKTIRVGGLVKKGSIKKISNFETEFTITDLANELKIRHSGLTADLFREEQGIVLEGKLNTKKQEFESKQMLIKHDENYTPPQIQLRIRN